MSDPEETPAQAIERLRREISQLRRLRAQVPMLILEPYVEEAKKHITESAARMTIRATVPGEEAIASSRAEQQAATQPIVTEYRPPDVALAGARVVQTATGTKGVTLYAVPKAFRSPEAELEVVILTETGELLTVKPEDLALYTPEAAAAVPAAAPKLAPGSRVRIRDTGKTGFVSELSDDKALIALDEGGFITRPVADLEPL